MNRHPEDAKEGRDTSSRVERIVGVTIEEDRQIVAEWHEGIEAARRFRERGSRLHADEDEIDGGSMLTKKAFGMLTKEGSKTIEVNKKGEG